MRAKLNHRSSLLCRRRSAGAPGNLLRLLLRARRRGFLWKTRCLSMGRHARPASRRIKFRKYVPDEEDLRIEGDVMRVLQIQPFRYKVGGIQLDSTSCRSVLRIKSPIIRTCTPPPSTCTAMKCPIPPIDDVCLQYRGDLSTPSPPPPPSTSREFRNIAHD